MLNTPHLCVSFCATEINIHAEPFRFLLVIGLFTFTARSLASMLSFSLNSPSVEGQGLETSDDFLAI